MLALRKMLVSKKGFALGYVLVLIGALTIISTSLLAISLQENKQSHMHAHNISSFYAAQTGANIAHSALKKYIEEINNEVTKSLDWSSLTQNQNYLDLLKYGPLGQAGKGDEVTLYLNLSEQNDYFLTYTDLPIINELSEHARVQTTITLSSPSSTTLAINNNGDSYTYSLKYTIVSLGESNTSTKNTSRIIGEGNALIKFTAGNFANYAFFTDSNISSNSNAENWFTSYSRIDGPTFTNDLFAFFGKPVFNGPVSQRNSTAIFFNG